MLPSNNALEAKSKLYRLTSHYSDSNLQKIYLKYSREAEFSKTDILSCVLKKMRSGT